MFKRIKQFILGKIQRFKQRKELKKKQKYYETLRYGATFIKVVQDDLANQQNKMNRHQRRRMQKSLQKGEITQEIVAYYSNQIDNLLRQIDNYLNPPKKVDGAKYYKELKNKEKK